MSIVRLIHITLDPSEAEKAIRVWKTECAPLMIQQKGCNSAERMHFGEAPPLQRRSRIHLLFGVGLRGRYRRLHGWRCPQGNRSPRSRSERLKGSGKAL
jgi:hypothetical protein